MRPSNPPRPGPPTAWRGGRAASPSAAACGRHFPCRGFTLLELLLVLFLMGLLASGALLMSDSVESQATYDDTRNRMAQVRRAIVGDVTRTVNGGPELGGFVADMGRLPDCLRELLAAQDCAATPAALPGWSEDAASGLWAGWRGPYLAVQPDSDGVRRFRDGYRNVDRDSDGGGPDSDDDALNYGWLFDAASNPGDLGLASRGANADDAGDDLADPALVVADDYSVLLASADVTLRNLGASVLPTAAQALALRLYHADDGAVSSASVSDAAALEALALAAGASLSVNFGFSSPPSLPLGVLGYAVVCHASSPEVVFDGDCDAGNAAPAPANVRRFALVPRQQPINLDWIVAP